MGTALNQNEFMPTENTKFFNVKDSVIALLLAGLFCIIGFFTLNDYGHTGDYWLYLYRGEAYINFLLTGQKNFSPEKIKCRFQDEAYNPFNYDLLTKKRTAKRKLLYLKTGESGQGFISTLFSAIGCEILFKRFGLMTDFNAHYAANLILASVSIFIFYLFVRMIFDRRVALFSTLFLVLFPRFIGHIPNDPKDPLVLYFGILAITTFWLALKNNGWKLLIPTTIFIGMAVTSKPTGYMIPAILFLWAIGYLIRPKRCSLEISGTFWVFLTLSFLIYMLTIYLLTPTLWVTPARTLSKISSLTSWAGNFVTSGPDKNMWIFEQTASELFDTRKKMLYAFFPMGLVFITTPVFTLFCGVIGSGVSLKGLKGVFKFNKLNNYLLVILWFLVPIIIVSLPGAVYYCRSPRHFMLFVPALCILSGLGVNAGMDFLIDKSRHLISLRINRIIAAGLVISGFTSIVVSIIDIHPYETTFFNRAIGGLAGAQRIKLPGGRVGIPGAEDYWGNSIRNGIRWINKNAEAHSYLALTYGEHIVVHSKELRDDLTLIKGKDFSMGVLTEGQERPLYVMILLSYWLNMYNEINQYCYKNLTPVYTIKAQGAPILFIYKL
jgi:hypothetical protein